MDRAGEGLRKGKGFNTSEVGKVEGTETLGPDPGLERKGNGDGARCKIFNASEVAVQSSQRKADYDSPMAASTQTREILCLSENDGLTATPTAKLTPTPTATPTLPSNASAAGEEPAGRRRHKFNGDFGHSKTGRGKPRLN